MQRFAIKIDKSVKARLKNLCRLCGIDNPNQVEILNAAEWIDLTIDDEVPLSRKIAECVGIEVLKNDKMPQRMCALCVDKINDFYEFREMCQATNIQTRKLLNLPDPSKIKAPKKVTIKPDEDVVESILGISGTETKTKTEPVSAKTGRKAKKGSASTSSTATTSNENRFRGMTKREIEITLELERIKKEEEDEMEAKVAETTTTTTTATAATTGRTKNGKKKKGNAKSALVDTPLLAPKAPNKRERKREMEQKRIEKKRKLDTKTKAPLPKKIKKEPGVSCLLCEERFEKISHRDTHLQAMHRPTISDYGCATCHEQFITLQEMTSHNEWHMKNNVPHKCVLCNATFPKLINFQSHLLVCVNPSFVEASEFAGNILCGNCNLEYETQNLYDWHACFIGDNSRCPQCQRIFIKRTVLLKHMFKCTGLPIDTVPAADAPPKRLKGRPKKKTAKGAQKATNKPDIHPQNSFKFEPETIIDQNADGDGDGDGDDGVFDTVDNSFMDTHFADSDNEFEPSNSIITSTGLDMPSSPAKDAEHDNSTINPDESQNSPMITSNVSATVAGVRSNANIELPLMECRVKLEPLDVASLASSSISINPVNSTISTNPEPHVEQPPERPLTVPPLTIRIKKEVIRPGYGDEFDVNLARNIKQERSDETYELAGSSAQAHELYSNVHKKSKHRDKQKKLYKKPALLAIKIKQEKMEREANDDDDYGESYPDYSMASGDYSIPSDAAVSNNSPFDNNPLPIITQIHSVIEGGVPVTTESSFNLSMTQIASKPSISSQPTNSLVPFTPIRIKSEFHSPLSPPLDTIDSTSISDSTSIPQQPDDEQQQQQHDNDEYLSASESSKPPENEQQPQTYNENHSEIEQKSNNDQQQSDETVDSTMVIENSNNVIENECMQSNCNENDTKECENKENGEQQSLQMECDTSSSLNENVESTTNMQTDEIVDSTAENDMELDANQTNAILDNSNPQICSSAVDSQPIPQETFEKDEPSQQPIESISETQEQNTFNENQACEEIEENINQSIDENMVSCAPSGEINPNVEFTSSSAAVDIDMETDTIENGQQLSQNLTSMEHDAATSTEMLQPINEICDVVTNALVTDVTNENSNISPTDFIENANDESLNFIDQLVHEVADTMVAPQSCENEHHELDKAAIIQNSAVPIESTEASSFMATTEFNYNIVGCSMKNAENNESTNAQAIEGADKSTVVNDTLLALADIPDIDYDLLPDLNDENECTSSIDNKVNACPPSVTMDDDNNELGATAAAAAADATTTVAAAAADGGNNDADTDTTGVEANAILNADTNIQNDVEEPKLPIN